MLVLVKKEAEAPTNEEVGPPSQKSSPYLEPLLLSMMEALPLGKAMESLWGEWLHVEWRSPFFLLLFLLPSSSS